jgi:NADP-dependent aldehyde dehydrogenase
MSSMSTTTQDSTTSVAAATASAAAAAAELADAPLERRAAMLRGIADAIDHAGPELVPIAASETGIAADRLTGEVARTTGQLRLFADVVEEGSFLEATIDHAVAGATPPRPDLRRLLVPVGPVAIYAASNFPFAFSIAGGDTASALAAGAPVVVKAHPGHPETSARTAAVVSDAIASQGLPAGTFAVVDGFDAGTELVQDPRIRAAAFTGSTRGGRALYDLAAQRPDPIPFYGELGSVNPVVITSAALDARADQLADGLVTSFTTSAGQLCTKPGVVFVPSGSDFAARVGRRVPSTVTRLLTPSIADTFHSRLTDLAALDGVEVVAGSDAAGGDAAPVVLSATTRAIAEHPELLDETFGPTTLLVHYESLDDLTAILLSIGGALSGTFHGAEGEEGHPVVAALREIAGRVLFDGWPTGVAVTWGQQHGGPWPSSTSLHTSVGASATRRFLRPLAFQSAPEAALPKALVESNPLAIPRRVDGILVLP